MNKRQIISALTAFTLSAVLMAPAAYAAGTGYVDVADSDWYAGAVRFCTENGLMSGTGNGAFSPRQLMTRGMVLAVLYRIAGSPAQAASGEFPDVPAGSWQDAPTAWAAAKGVAAGTPGEAFGAADPILREELALFLWRCADSPEARAEDFADEALISADAAPAVDWARASGVLSGRDGNLFDPKGVATRAEVATVLMSYTRTYQVEPGTATVRSAMDVMCEASGLAAMEDGSLLVTDTYRKVIWRVKGGASAVYAGGETAADLYGEPMGGYNDDTLAKTYFQEPWAIAPFLDGWAVSDAGNGAVRLVQTTLTQTVNGHTNERLKVTGMGVAFQRPTGLAADDSGNLYVADALAGAIYKINAKGLVTTVIAGLQEPTGLCWKDGSLYAAETGMNRIIKVLSDGRLETVAGSGLEGLTDGAAAQAAFSGPQGVAVGDDGTVYVSDTGNSAVRQIKDGAVTTLIVQDKEKMELCPISPVGLLVQDGQLYICDSFSRKLFVLQLG